MISMGLHVNAWNISSDANRAPSAPRYNGKNRSANFSPIPTNTTMTNMTSMEVLNTLFGLDSSPIAFNFPLNIDYQNAIKVLTIKEIPFCAHLSKITKYKYEI